MSISSRIQEIETHIGDVYDTIDYSYDTTGVNKNIINIPKYLKKGYIDIINNGIDTLYNNFPKVSGIGSNLSLTPTYEAPMKLNEIQGDTFQKNTPTPDTPVEIQSVTGLQNIEVCGKNLFNISSTPTQNTLSQAGITATINNDGTITCNGTKSANYKYIRYDITLPAGTYYFSGCPSSGSSTTYSTLVQTGTVSSTQVLDTGSGNTFTLTETTTIQYFPVRVAIGSVTFNNTIFKPMIAKVPVTYNDFEKYQSQTYNLSLGNIELNKIGDYQDRIYKDNGKWYVEKQIGKVVLDGSETWETQWNGDNIHGWRTTIPNLKQTTSSRQSSYVISDYYETRTQDENFSTGNYGISNRANQSQIIIKNNDITSVNDFKTWLGTHNTTVLYQLATPTYTEITNTELIEDLETLYTAKSQEGTTNISITSEDLEMILNVSALKGDA